MPAHVPGTLPATWEKLPLGLLELMVEDNKLSGG